MSRPIFSLVVVLFFVLCLVTPSSSHGTGVGDHDEPTNHSDLASRSLISTKIGCLVVIFLVTFVSGVSPCFLRWNQGFLVLGTQFAGGIFLATGLMHFLSDADETFRDLLPENEYPFAYMLACVGYLVTMLADCIVSHVHSKIQHQGPRDLELQQGTEQTQTNQNKTSNSHVTASSNTIVSSSSQDSTSPTASSLRDNILLIMALCFHSIFEGIAIGVSESKPDAWRALWTITLHKIFAAIAMGIALLRTIPNRPFFSSLAYSFAFAISSPIGVAIGIVIDVAAKGSISDWIFAVSMSLACGVFTYVSINHLLAKGYFPNKRVHVDEPPYRFGAVALGVAVIAIVMIWDT